MDGTRPVTVAIANDYEVVVRGVLAGKDLSGKGLGGKGLGEVRFDRTNGCEIARWDALAPLLGSAGGATM